MSISSDWAAAVECVLTSPMTYLILLVVHSLSQISLFARCSTISQSLLKFLSIESVMPSNHLILCHPLLHLPSIFPSNRAFSGESLLRIRWPKYWSFSFSSSPSNEYSGLIFFRIDWFDLLAGDSQESSPAPRFESINYSVLSLLYGPTLESVHGKTIALLVWTFVGKVCFYFF